jgi:hypothetical protein
VALTVTATAPSITTQPIAATAIVGANATFTVVASGSTPFTYQWRKGGVNLVNGAVVGAAKISAKYKTITLQVWREGESKARNFIIRAKAPGAFP